MSYDKNQGYRLETQFGGWTRIDMLLAIYDKAIVAARALQVAASEGDEPKAVEKLIEAQKCILAIHAGLKPDEHDIAYNIARLLNFVLMQLEEKQYENAVTFLEKLRDGFAAIYDEAVELEKNGNIPPFHIQTSSELLETNG